MNIHVPKILAGSKYAVRMPIGLMDVVRTAPRQAFIDYYHD
jgi:zinc protease